MKSYARQPVGEGLSKSKKAAILARIERDYVMDDNLDDEAREHAKNVRCPSCNAMAVVISGRVAIAHKTTCPIFRRRK